MAHPVVVVVDVQERLFNAVDAERRDDMVTNVKILVSETVVFQLLGSADSDAFRELSKLLR
jgi:hypothetical protein